MALKRTLEKAEHEKLEDGIKALYVEKDGKFHLDVESIADETGDKKGKTVPLSRLNEEIAKRKKADETVAAVAEELKKSVPEAFAEIVPNLPAGELVTWIRNAEAKGLFTEKPGKVETKEEIDARRAADKKAGDMTGLSPQAKMAKGYTTTKN